VNSLFQEAMEQLSKPFESVPSLLYGGELEREAHARKGAARRFRSISDRLKPRQARLFAWLAMGIRKHFSYDFLTNICYASVKGGELDGIENTAGFNR